MIAVRRLKTKYNKNESKQDLLDVEIDAAVVTETILALAEMQSKQPNGCCGLQCGLNDVIMVVSLCAGFAQQVVDFFGTVR
jgi:hypothetical protein